MALSNLERSRIGRGLNLKSVFSKISGRVEYNDGTDRVNQSLGIIFATAHGEVAMLPLVGSGLAEMLFEPADDILKDRMEIYIRDAIEKLEPRISLQNIVIDTVDNYMFVTVDYILKGTNTAGKFDYQLTKQTGGDRV